MVKIKMIYDLLTNTEHSTLPCLWYTPSRCMYVMYSLLPFYSARFISSFGGLHMVLFHTFGFVVSLDLFMVYKYVALPGCRCVYVRLYV